MRRQLQLFVKHLEKIQKKRKILDTNIENNEIFQIVCSHLILSFACLLAILFGPYYFYSFLFL